MTAKELVTSAFALILGWQAIDDFSAQATLKDGEAGLTLLFHFDENGLIKSARSKARWLTVVGAAIPTPWEGRWTNYELRDGMSIPIDGEVAWQLPQGPKPYWRGRIKSIRYEFAQWPEPPAECLQFLILKKRCSGSPLKPSAPVSEESPSEVVGPENICDNVHDALRRAEEVYERLEAKFVAS